MSIFNHFASRGATRSSIKRNGGLELRTVNDNRKPLYIIYVLDKSLSMSGSKIKQLNDGVKKLIRTLKEFEESNPLYKVYVLSIDLDSYGKAVFPEFRAISRGLEEIFFEAEGCTVLSASLATLKTYISHKHLKDERAGREDKGYNKAVSVILMSDGWPTDANGVEQTPDEYRGVVDDFKKYLRDMEYARNVDLYSIGVGEDACEDMLRYFCDGSEMNGAESHFYRVDECDSIANALDFMTRATLAHHTKMPVHLDIDDDDDADDSNDDYNYADDDDDGVTQDVKIIPPSSGSGSNGNSLKNSTKEEGDATLDTLFDGLDEE